MWKRLEAARNQGFRTSPDLPELFHLRRDNLAASALMAKMGVQPEERGKVMLACLRMIARLNPTPKKLRAIQRFITAYLPLDGMQKEEVEEAAANFNPEERTEVMEYLNVWQREGKHEGKVEDTLKLLTRRIGTVSLAAQKRINKLPLELLDELFDAAFEFDKKAALNEWLRKHARA